MVQYSTFLLFLTVIFFLSGVLAAEGENIQAWENSPLRWNVENKKIDTVIKEVFREGIKLRKPLELSELTIGDEDFTLAGNVNCGGGYCPTEAPICCGEYPYYYCIPGGSKCCNLPGGNAVACEQSAECCASIYNASCCEKGSTCTRNGDRSKCVKEACNKYETSDLCLNENNECSWCCEERRCVSKGKRCSLGSNSINFGETCPSSCQYAETCEHCLLYNGTTNASDTCIWCCSTQSCIPARNTLLCGNDQTVHSQSLCPACQANGIGLNPQYLGTFAQFFAMLSGIVLVLGIASCLGILRAFIYFRGTMMMNNGMRVSDVEAQLSVRRYGFGSNEHIPVQTRINSSLKRYVKKITSIFGSNSKTKNENTDIDGVNSLNKIVKCSNCQRILHLGALISVANTMKGIKNPQNTPLGVSQDVSHIVDDYIVILLPCSHLFCRPCMGLNPIHMRGHDISTSSTYISTNFIPQLPDADTVRENYIDYHLTTRRSITTSHENESFTAEERHVSREEQQQQQDVSLRSLEDTRADKNKNTNDRSINNNNNNNNNNAREPRRRIQKFKEGLLRSLRRLKRRNSNSNLQGEKVLENIVLKKIKEKCPTCQRSVNDVLFPENILQL